MKIVDFVIEKSTSKKGNEFLALYAVLDCGYKKLVCFLSDYDKKALEGVL